MSERQFRRYRDRYEEAGGAGLVDRRLGKVSGRRVSGEMVESGFTGSGTVAGTRSIFTNTWFPITISAGVYLHQGAVARSRSGGAGQTAWRAPPQATAQALQGHDAASGRQPARLAGG
ncbi:hypothetical protein ACWGTI_27655 [Mesorhizobium sp. ArgA1]